MQVKPIGNRVLVVQVEPPPRTTGGIIVPEAVKEHERRQRARVVAVGEGRWLESGKLIPVPVSVGDHVLFGARTVSTLVPKEDPADADEPQLHIIDAENIVGVVGKSARAFVEDPKVPATH